MLLLFCCFVFELLIGDMDIVGGGNCCLRRCVVVEKVGRREIMLIWGIDAAQFKPTTVHEIHTDQNLKALIRGRADHFGKKTKIC